MYTRYKGFGKTQIFKCSCSQKIQGFGRKAHVWGKTQLNVIWYAKAAQSICMNKRNQQNGCRNDGQMKWMKISNEKFNGCVYRGKK